MPEAQRLVAAACLAAASLAHASPEQVQPGPLRIEGMAPWGSITRLMEPDYPKEALASRAKYFVDISGRVSHVGTLEDVVYDPGSPEAAIMVGPLREVMKHWQFSTPMDDECQPSAVVVKNRIWFDFEAERPKLSVLVVHDEKGPEKRTLKATRRVDPMYPYSMRRLGWQANVFVKVVIDAEGNVTTASATAYPKEAGVDLSAFEQSSVQALGKWQFPPVPDEKRVREACYTIFYRLKG